jgi:hypothetical protein
VGVAAYAGLYLLLTAEDRRERAALVAAHGSNEDALLRAPPPGREPPGGDPAAVSAWNRAVDLRRDREAYERHGKKIRYLAIGLFGALAVQIAVTAAVLVRSSRAPASAPGSPGGPGARARRS